MLLADVLKLTCHTLAASKDAVIGQYYSNEMRPMLASSWGSTAARWYNRAGFAEDPWISLTHHDDAIGSGDLLYGGAKFGGSPAENVLPIHNGANVFVRLKEA